MEGRMRSHFARRAILISLFAFAMAYFESTAVLYLERAIKVTPQTIFPLRNLNTLDSLGSIEIGREAATLVMLAIVGWLAGRTGLERLAWSALAFGIWDIGYYFWLWVFIGWPSNLTDFDLLFLLPVPWVGPVWAPILVSLALILFGFIVARRLRLGENVLVRIWNFSLLIGGGLLVILSFTIDGSDFLRGAIPRSFDWPIYVSGMFLALIGVTPLAKSTPRIS